MLVLVSISKISCTKVFLKTQVNWQNYVRVVETWWDEYNVYFYATRPESMEIPYGDISEQVT